MGEARNSPATVGELIESGAAALDRAGVCFGHGTDNAVDEAASLVYHVIGLDHAERAYDRPVGAAERGRVRALLNERIATRRPLPYLLGEAWFAGLPFFVDERVLIPRSPFAELLERRFEPWIDPDRVGRILEIGTGSGCIAIAAAFAFPAATVLATDVSPAALEVAASNVERHGVGDRVRLRQGDLFAGVDGTFDLVLSNPPYVPDGELERLPAEYAHEPRLALGSGPDGLASTRRILQDAARHLEPDGWLAIEVGSGWRALEAAYPALPFVWPEFERGGEGIALLAAADLPRPIVE